MTLFIIFNLFLKFFYVDLVAFALTATRREFI